LLALLGSELEGLAAVGIATRLDGQGYERQSREREEVLLRVTQEALANVAKHSGARTVRVLLEGREHEVVLRVADDGRGFDPATAAREAGHPGRGGRGLGLFTMRERIRGLAGRFRIESAPGMGTIVEVALPR
jgi:signal transduction histidine kinase